MTKILVVGAGMAGLLAGTMLRSECDGIVEKQKQTPNNHSALLRFRSSVVGDVLGVPFKQVKVIKGVAGWKNPIADALAYSFKATGSYTLRSSLSAKGELEERFIAPPDFIQKMADRVQCNILYDAPVEFKKEFNKRPVISTAPMPALMKALNYPHKDEAKFEYQHGANINATISDCDAYATLYVPNPDCPFNRISLTGSKLTIEFARMDAARVSFDANRYIADALGLLGFQDNQSVALKDVSVSDQKYAKILPIDEGVRKRFIIWASEQCNIFSLGRFATWRPGLLMDDVVEDVRVIQRLIHSGHSYEHRKA